MSVQESISTVGGLLPAELLERVRAGDPDLEGTSPESYGLVPGERLNDHITRSWNRLRGIWEGYAKQLAALPETDRATALTRQRWCRPLFDELGFAGLPAASGLEIDGKAYPISHEWGGHVPVHIMGARVGIDRRAPGVAGAASMSPHGLVQEFLNRSPNHLWGIVTNGSVLRILRDNATLTRQAYVEFDLQAMFDGELFSDFAVMWLTCHRTRFEGDPPEKCTLERWAAQAAETGTRALDKLRDGVERAIVALGSGFVAHPANGALRDAVRRGDVPVADLQRQVLRVVYRLLFLLVAEGRGLLHPPGADPTAVERYRRFYSVGRLRTLAAARRGTAHDDLWEGLGVTMRGLWRDGVPALGLPALGSELWSPEATAALAGARLHNRNLLDAVRALCFVRDDEARVDRAVDYKNLGAEELGSIYESLLELHAEVDVDARTFTLTTAAGHERKTTGSYYTPTSLISELLDSALDPVLDEAASSPDPEQAILRLKVLDPAAGSGHFLIAAANRIAGRLASIRAGGGEPAPDEIRTALRDVVSHCIYAIDVNPMAVELCKVSMWLEAMEPGKPLSFLDHRIVCGNALLGATPALLAAGIPDEAFVELTGDDKSVVASLKKRNRAARKGQQTLFGDAAGPSVTELAEAAQEVAGIDEGTLEAVETKADRWRALTDSVAYRNAVFAADLWCAAFVAPKTEDAPAITHETYRLTVEHPERVPEDVRRVVRQMAERYGFLHWHLAFLDAYDASGEGGFDVVLGNPPWEKVQFTEKEFFAARAPEIAALAGDRRKQAISRLADDDPVLYAEYQAAVRRADGERHFIGRSGRFPLCGRGKVNTYAVFAEAMRDGTTPTGRTGVIVPTGIATDDTTKHFFADCVDSKRLASLFDFENRDKIFADVDSRMKFCLLTLTGAKRPVEAAEFVFFAHRTSDLDDPERRFTLTPTDLALINPNTKTAPVFRTRRDAEITAKIYRNVPVLVRDGDPDGNPWGVEFQQGLFNMTSDSHLFRTADELRAEGAELHGNIWVKGDQRWLPLYEAKMVHHFNHRFGDYAMRKANSGDTSLPEVPIDRLGDPTYLVQPRYWVRVADVRSALRGRSVPCLVGLRKTARSTDARTSIASLLPLVGVGDKFPLIYPQRIGPWVVAAWLSSFACDYAVRQKAGGTDLSFFIIAQMPVPADDSRVGFLGGPIWFWIEKRVLELSYVSWDLSGFAQKVGYCGPPFRWIGSRRELLRAELDAAMFHLYGLDRDEVDYVMETFPIVKRKDIAAHGEYRTKRLILERYDAMAEAAATGTEYETVLDPPPADPSLAHDPSTRPEWADWYLGDD